MHFRSNPTFSKSKNINVDRENGVIKNVQIVKQGTNKNGTYFGETYLKALADGANEQKQGVKSRFGHPNMCSTSLGSYIGRYKNFQAKGDKVFADLHLDPISKKTQVEGKGISMFEYIMDMAESNGDMFGNSIHIPTPEFEEDPIRFEGKNYHSHIYNGILASDVVDDPAATDGLFSNSDDLGVIVTEFLDTNPNIFATIQKDPSIIQDFFERYSNYLTIYNKQFDMSFLDNLKKKLGKKETFDIEETLASGDIVKVITEDEAPKVGDQVTDADGKALADGEHTTKDGSVWTIEGGAIADIKAAEPAPSEEEEPTMSDMMSKFDSLITRFDKFEKAYKKDLKENQDAIELVSDSLNEKFSNLAKTVKSNGPDYKAEPKNPKKEQFASGYDPDKAREMREKKDKSKSN
ncbi:hypothetical protein [Aegicerativicinus sediminis]|uniref:hypothetical protein n=1 Tax=Aegicerativicinus sediminis TaxID=2893202 RepID=UPI001E5C0419|nr:hypothetical protein [Aegicerativicinus sediminis]